MTTIKIPADVWKLIIDKIEPIPYNLPEYVLINGDCYNTKNITKLTGPFTHDYGQTKIFIKIYCTNQCDDYITIYSDRDPELYKMFLAVINRCRQQSL